MPKSYNPIAQDPEYFDADYPAANGEVTFMSGGAKLNGVLYMTQGAGPHPIVMLLHGFPGYERNFDLAQILRRAGWHVLVFHYRGAWGSGGNFAFAHVLDDVVAARDWLRSDAAQRDYRCDGDRIVLVGHSMGGWAALLTAARDESFLGVASLAGVHVSLVGSEPDIDDATRRMILDFFAVSMPPLHGTSPSALLAEGLKYQDEWVVFNHVNPLKDRKLLLIAAARDDGVPPMTNHTPLVYALEKAGAQHLTHEILESDHAFADRRVAVAQLVLDWLQTL